MDFKNGVNNQRGPLPIVRAGYLTRPSIQLTTVRGDRREASSDPYSQTVPGFKAVCNMLWGDRKPWSPSLYALLYVRGVTGMGHPTGSIGRVAPTVLPTNLFLVMLTGSLHQSIGWASLPHAECLTLIYTKHYWLSFLHHACMYDKYLLSFLVL